MAASDWWNRIRVIVAAGAALIAGILLYGFRRYRSGRAVGEATARADADIASVREAELRQDDEAVLREFRRHQ